jgi:hypothetical protein
MTVATVETSLHLDHGTSGCGSAAVGCQKAFAADPAAFGRVTDIADLVDDVDALVALWTTSATSPTQGLATALFCAVRLPQPLLLEGEAGSARPRRPRRSPPCSTPR